MRTLSMTSIAILGCALSGSAFADETAVRPAPATHGYEGYQTDSGFADRYQHGNPQAEANNRAAMRLQDDLTNQRASQR